MRSHAQLCHVSSDRCVVLVEAYEGTTPLGSALGEGRSAIEAEDQALERLRARLGNSEPARAEEAMPSTPRPELRAWFRLANQNSRSRSGASLRLKSRNP